jgi:glucan phosphoethanolaminetransferase (alkaline phosphatase superfamily)
MIQRIQSIFLLLAAGGAFGVFAAPFATTQEAAQGTVFADTVFNVQDHLGLIVLFALAGLLALVGIFLFKNRKLQMRMAIFAFIANLAAVALGAYFFIQAEQTMGDRNVQATVGAYLPIATFIFTLLAYRFIKKDEQLVKSMDRLR